MESRPDDLPREGRASGAGSRFRSSDLGLLAAITLSALFTVLGITGKILEPESPQEAGGARKIDASRYERLIREGVLSGREALFFHAVEAGAEGGGGGALSGNQ